MQELWLIFQNNPVVAYLVIAGLGLCVGSFLNVVIHRLPLMMQQSWRQECQLFLHPDQPPPPEPLLTLSTPASRCPQCGHLIRWYENIPVLSWLVLRGQCSTCKTPISIRYPLIELSTMLLSVLILSVFGPTLKMFLALLFLWILIALTFIDLDHQLLPDSLTYGLCLLGLMVNSYSLFTTPQHAIWGVVAGVFPLWLIGELYKIIRKTEGMGIGDSKLLAAFGAWLGPTLLLPLVLIASLLGSVAGAIYYLKRGESLKYPFGPYLAIAGVIMLLWGQQIVTGYLEYARVSPTP
jgi:leader peptidase (prepilin peptidase) / N-methyltransferase